METEPRGYTSPQINIWISKFTTWQKRCFVTLPKAWRDRHLKTHHRFVYLEEMPDGTLLVCTEAQWLQRRMREAAKGRRKGKDEEHKEGNL